MTPDLDYTIGDGDEQDVLAALAELLLVIARREAAEQTNADKEAAA